MAHLCQTWAFYGLCITPGPLTICLAHGSGGWGRQQGIGSGRDWQGGADGASPP